ncbi:Putative amidase domain-containing protein [Salinibacillus kushneri]|uniref:Putative amidase domain-containing protein n=1 Tax=Salinibacillus kushneri TaxID=237682 RepID=A0A1I0AMK6_9BACI|nr:amidase domain-containing protein [Salinibacillus kushneri]SES95103.1 Putative amidase domain-containing protein [Salinibacillus kushneri]
MKNSFLQKEWENIIRQYTDFKWWKQKKDAYENRGVQVLQVTGAGKPYHQMNRNHKKEIHYYLHLSYLLKQTGKTYLEEELIPVRLNFQDETLSRHEMIPPPSGNQTEHITPAFESDTRLEQRAFSYDRRAAVRYAERWWNDYNPEYKKFEVDCTNYISQCLRAGGAPMWGASNRSKGWWYSGDNWSYSWSVAHAFRWYLSGSNQGLTAKEVENANELLLGDVICYDFEGDGNWNHTTIVVAKDGNGEPLVNAHTVNSRNRYWSYEDSHAWTPNCQYKFFRIGE